MAFVSCYNPDSTNEQSTFYNDRIRKETINALKIYSKLFLEHKGMLWIRIIITLIKENKNNKKAVLF